MVNEKSTSAGAATVPFGTFADAASFKFNDERFIVHNALRFDLNKARRFHLDGRAAIASTGAAILHRCPVRITRHNKPRAGCCSVAKLQQKCRITKA